MADLDFQAANLRILPNVELMDVIKLTRSSGFTPYSFEGSTPPFKPNGRDQNGAYPISDTVVRIDVQRAEYFGFSAKAPTHF